MECELVFVLSDATDGDGDTGNGESVMGDTVSGESPGAAGPAAGSGSLAFTGAQLFALLLLALVALGVGYTLVRMARRRHDDEPAYRPW